MKTDETGKATFEDRLLTELQRELRLRNAQAPVPRVRHRRVTPRRIGLVLGLAATGLAVAVMAPSSPGGSEAFAVERNGDGTLTIRFNEVSVDRDAQEALGERLREIGAAATFDTVPDGMNCGPVRGDTTGHPVYYIRQKDGDGLAKLPPDAVPPPRNGASREEFEAWRKLQEQQVKITVGPGDTVVFETTGDPSDPSRVLVYAVKGEAAPCVPGPDPRPHITPGPLEPK
ncbi:hypothetical protein [Streptomyces mesophilus]|uniref:hypothetical protein n=1 Tax=Streptomyces mesophilus TaxID=1775132 RepID=UPI003329C98F